MRDFQEADKHRQGALNKIEMIYVLREICGLNEQQSDIMLTQCGQPEDNKYVYGNLIEKLNPIDI